MRNDAYRTEIIEHNGYSFRAEYSTDVMCETPWEWADGHGTVSDWTQRDKRPGEVVLCSDRSSKRYYDMQGAIKTAKAEGWGYDYDSVLPTDTPGQKAVKAAQNDFNYLKAWCNNDWWYSCLHVSLLDPDGEDLEDYDDYLGGVEDGYYRNTGDQYALEMASGILTRYERDQDAELVNELHHVKDHALYMTGVV
jgi:hypothetical protein